MAKTAKPKAVKPKISKLEKSKLNPNSRFWRNKAYALWVAVAREISGNTEFGKCRACGECSKPCDTHHILPRELHKLKFRHENAIILCKSCHKYRRGGLLGSAHKDSFTFYEWFRENCQDQHKWCKSQIGNDLKTQDCTLKESYEKLQIFIEEYRKTSKILYGM